MGTSVILDAIHDAVEFCGSAHLDQLASIHHMFLEMGWIFLTSVLQSLPSPAFCTVKRAIDFQTSGWPTVLPLVCHYYDLSAWKFCDALSLHYHRPLTMLLSYCNSCGSDLVCWTHKDVQLSTITIFLPALLTLLIPNTIQPTILIHNNTYM